jgi:hypothetical protein
MSVVLAPRLGLQLAATKEHYLDKKMVVLSASDSVGYSVGLMVVLMVDA